MGILDSIVYKLCYIELEKMLYKIILSGGLTSTEWNEKWKKKKSISMFAKGRKPSTSRSQIKASSILLVV